MSYRSNYRQNSYAGSKAEYIEFMRAYNNAVATATYTEEEIDVPISRSYGSQRALAVALHAIEYHAIEVIVIGNNLLHQWQLSKKSKSAMADPSTDTDLIDYCNCHQDMETSGAGYFSLPIVHHFPKPILVGNNKLYAGFYQNSGGNKKMGMRIHFTPRFVSDSQLMEALID